MEYKESIGQEKVIAVLDGLKASNNEKSVASLTWVFRNLNLCANDELVVLVILNPAIPNAKLCCFGDQRSLNTEDDEYVNFLEEELRRRREGYLEMLRPFYKKCKLFGAKFEVKVFAGCKKAAIISAEAIRTKATWIIMERRLMEEGSLQLGNESCCRIVAVNNDAETESELDTSIPSCSSDATADHLHIKIAISSEDGLHQRQYNMPDFSCDDDCRNSTDVVISNENQQLQACKREEIKPAALDDDHEADVPEDPVTPPECYKTPRWNLDENSPQYVKDEEETYQTFLDNERQSVDCCYTRLELRALNLPMELTQEEIQITSEWEIESHSQSYPGIGVFEGTLRDSEATPVLIKRFPISNMKDAIDAEKRIAMLMFHKNILSPVGFFEQCSDCCFLVYMYCGEGSLQQFLTRRKGRATGLTCSERMKIAIETSTAIRYMHEECPRAPVAHGNIRPCNIYLGQELEPYISGFDRAEWLGEDCIDVLNTMSLLKEDVYSFGVLLLRLFCRRQSWVEDDTQLIQWARPLLLQAAFHEVLDECMDNMDMYEVYKVMSAAGQCTRRKPSSRPTISQVVGILKGLNPCMGSGSPVSSECTLAAWQMR